MNGDDVLARLRKVPVSTWNYISEGNGVRHLGPMAEDFYGAFELGTSDKAIGVQDLARRQPRGASRRSTRARSSFSRRPRRSSSSARRSTTLEQRLAALEALILKQAEGQQK